MDFEENKPYISCVMNYFHCSEKMAKTILDSSKKNGELESIKNLCLRGMTNGE